MGSNPEGFKLFQQGQQQHHLFSTLPFGFKLPLILELAMIWLECHISYIIPMGYSYWCSHLNLTIHVAKSKFHFTYSVSPQLIRILDIPLVYLSSVAQTAEPFLTIGSTLSYFRSLFDEYTRPYIFISYVCKVVPYKSVSYSTLLLTKHSKLNG